MTLEGRRRVALWGPGQLTIHDVSPNGRWLISRDERSVVRLSSLDLSADGKRMLAMIPSTPPQLVIYPTGAGVPLRLERGSIEQYVPRVASSPVTRVSLFEANEVG